MGSLTVGLLSRIELLPVMLPDAAVATLQPGVTPAAIFSYADLSRRGRVVRARHLNVQDPGTTGAAILYATADRVTPPPADAHALNTAAALGPGVAHHEAWDLQAADYLLLRAQNQTGSAATVWLNWVVEADRPSIARLAQLGRPLDPRQEDLAKKYGLTGSTPRGVLPRSLDWIIQNEYRNNILAASTVALTQAVAPGVPVSFVQMTPPADACLVLTSLYVSPGSGADGLTLLYGVDGDNDLYSLPAYPLGSAGAPVAHFLQARRQLNISCTATSTVAAVTMAAVVWQVRLTPEIEAHQGSVTAGEVAEKVEVGVL